MDIENMNYEQAEAAKKIKKSKALYALMVYGLIIIFALILLPFLPVSETMGMSIFEFLLETYNKKIQDNLIVTISAIANSLILLILAIVFISKLSKHKAGAAYSMFKYFATIIFIGYALYLYLYFSDNMDLLMESNHYWYWPLVLEVFALSSVFMLLARTFNGALRPHFAKGFYYLIGIVGAIAIYVYSFNNYQAFYIRNEWHEYCDIYQIIYDTIFYGISIFMIRKAFLFLVPVNDCFSYMYKHPKLLRRGKRTPLPYAFNLLMVLCSFGLFIFFHLTDGAAEFNFILSIMGYFLLQVIVAVWFNRAVAKTKVEEEKYYQEENKTIFKQVNYSTAQKDKSNKYLWNIDTLRKMSLSYMTKEKVNFNDLSINIQNFMKSKGLAIELIEIREVLAAIASSKLIFIKCNNKDLVKNFSQALSQYFDGETFFEKRADEKKEESINDDLTTDENISISPEENSEIDIDAKNAEDNQVKEEITKENTEQSEKTKEKSEKDIQEEIRQNKYGIASGIFVSYFLENQVSFAFLDSMEKEELSDYDADILSDVCAGNNEIYIGKKEFLPQSENYGSGTILVPENLRIIVFVNENDVEISTSHDWVKYATVLKLTLNECLINDDDESISTYSIYHDMLNQISEEEQERSFLPEDCWKKIDRLEDKLSTEHQKFFGNKFTRQLEKYSAIVLACGANKEQTLDIVLANKIIPYATTKRHELLNSKESDFALTLDEIFGMENIPITKNAIAEYGLKK